MSIENIVHECMNNWHSTARRCSRKRYSKITKRIKGDLDPQLKINKKLTVPMQNPNNF
jgi:hypothetical protein